MSGLDRDLSTDLEASERRNLRRRRVARETARFPHIDIEGKRRVNFAANDYLGLAGDDRVAEALSRGVSRWGAGAGAAHLLSGHTQAHEAFEEALANYLGTEAALLFSTGYMANLGVLGALAGRGDTIIADRLNHASLIDGARLSRAKLRRYAHADVQAAADRLEVARGRRLLVTDGVFSMDGDVAPLGALAEMSNDAGAVLMVDDAHGFGVLGERGRGSVAAAGLDACDVPVQVVTLGKALGVSGGAVGASRALIDTLVQRARTWIYTTAQPPALAEAMTQALAIAGEEEWRRTRLRELVARFHALADARGLPHTACQTPIQPVMVGASDAALWASRQLFERGFYVPAIRPPTVPAGKARLRLSFSALHTDQQLDALVEALGEVLGNG